MKYAAIVMVLLALSVSNSGRAVPQDRLPYRHAYYLFKENPSGCDACYIPLLITKEPLEGGPKTQEIKDCIPIVTYERDSIWQTLARMTVKGTDVDVAPRKIRLTMYYEKDPNFVLHAFGSVDTGERVRVPVYKDISFRYQEVSPAEVVKLLENPLGTIPISRVDLPQMAINSAEIISDFKSIK